MKAEIRVSLEKLDDLISNRRQYLGRDWKPLAVDVLELMKTVERDSYDLPMLGGKVRLVLADIKTELKKMKAPNTEFDFALTCAALAMERLRLIERDLEGVDGRI